MKRQTISIVIIFGVLSIISILLVQIFWINRTIRAQKDAITIQEKQDSLNIQQFEESVRIALKEVTQNLSTNEMDESDLYGAVVQKSANYYLVDINEDLHPYYLEQLLKRTFYKHNINENFQYGIYDCFNDSIIYGNLIQYTPDSIYSTSDKEIGIPSPEMNWKKDGHYFTVFFPAIYAGEAVDFGSEKSPWIYLGIIAMLLLIFFAIAIYVILRQRKISEIKSDFVNNMTHELKTPISTIGLSTEMLLKLDFLNHPDKTKKYIEIIYKENKRLEKQVERVLNMARIDSGELQLKAEEASLHSIIEEAIENFKFNQEFSGGQITTELHASTDRVTIDIVHMSNILLNLLDNAVKYSREAPLIKITSSNKEEGIEVCIADNGIGISTEEIGQVFDQFYRVPTGNQHDVKGFGLGLFYVKLIIEKHKGKIEVESKLGEGSRFIFWLPLGKV